MINNENHQNWRFWPVILLGSLFTINSSLISLGIPILFYQKGVSVGIIGLLSSALIISYCFSPILFNKVSDKLGRRRSVILAMCGVCGVQITYFFVLDPLFFFFARFIEGLFLGFFAPNLQASISDNPLLDHSKYLSRLSLSFNSGALIGLLSGTIFLFFVNNMLLVFYIAPIIMIVNSIFAIVSFQESTKFDNGNSVRQSANNFQANNEIGTHSASYEAKYYIPVVIPILILFGFSFAMGSANFIYPIKSEILGFQPYSAYFLSFIATFAQTLTTYKASLLKVKILKLTSLISIILVAIIIIIFGINNFFFSFIILFAIIGLCAGVLYGSVLKFFMILNLTKQTSRYSSILESLTGITYFATQITAGIIGGLRLELAFFTLSAILVFIFIIYLVYSKKIKSLTPMIDRGEKSFIRLPKTAAKLYDKMMQLEPMKIQRHEIAEMLLTQIKEGTLLDVGTGHGRLLKEINKLNPKVELYGLDISEKMINLAKINLKNIQADLQQGNITSTNYKSKFFDLITCTGSFYLWNAPIEGLNEIHRILKPNKTAILFESHSEYEESNLKVQIKKNLSNEGFFNRKFVPFFLKKQLKMTYDISELRNILDKSLFKDSFSVSKVTLANLPIWLRIELRKT